MAFRLLRSSWSSRTADGACFVAALANEFFEGDGAYDPAVVGAAESATWAPRRAAGSARATIGW
jgi:hypothetical protein